jgi:hypothetical protein
MDLAKFISLLSKEALYFSCPSEFHDPFEGLIPRSWLLSSAKISDKLIRDIELEKSRISNIPKFKDILKPLDEAVSGVNNSFVETINEFNAKYGVNCWHKSDYESEAMWKLYSASGQGIAIESTIKQLKNSILFDKSLEI